MRMKSLRDVADNFTCWVVGGEDVGTDVRSALAWVREHCPDLAQRAGTAKCFTVTGSILPSGPVHAILGTIDYRTWARGRHGANSGPPYVRNAAYPWGLPWITGTVRDQLEQENNRLREVLGLLHRLSAQHPSAKRFFAFPEYFGMAQQGSPASPWMLPEVRRWARKEGWCRYALFQCELGPEPQRFPCGLLTSEVLNSRYAHGGWPQFRREDHKYVGPLPPECSCGNRHDNARTPANTSEAAQTVLRPAFLRWLWTNMLKTGLLRTGKGSGDRPRASLGDHYSYQSDSTDEDTWITSHSSTSSSVSSTSSSPSRSPATSARLQIDQGLSKNLGLGDVVFEQPVLNIKDKDSRNFVNQVPTVKAVRRMLLDAYWRSTVGSPLWHQGRSA